MNSAVIVLTPNGRRQTVKVQPNTILLKVLEEVCEKHKFDSHEYDLKHHKRIVDLTTPFRFAGLPNNGLLEMVEVQKKRQHSEVELIVQLSDGSRVNGQFKPDTNLLDMVQQLCPNENTGNDLFAIYMRTEVPSGRLSETTLKDLGLMGGRAIIRLVHRDPNAAKIQTNVALNLQPKPVEPDSPEDEEASSRENKVRKTGDKIHSAIVSTLTEEKASKVEPSTSTGMFEPSTSSATQMPNNEVKIAENSQVPAHMRAAMEPDTKPKPIVADEVEPDEDVGEVHILGERNAVLFNLDAANSAEAADLPDSFFDLNVNDIQLLIKDLRSQAQGTVHQPLLTAKLREMDEEQSQLTKLNRYKTVIIRVQFPNRFVLQGTFTPYETIEKVMDFVRSYLVPGDIEFHLYTTPPKQILSKELRLFEAECVPSAVLHFGCEEKRLNYLNEDILDKVSSPKASLKQASVDRGLKESTKSSFDISGRSTSTTTNEQRERISNSFKTSTSVSTSDAQLPQWFKSLGK